MRGPFLLTLLLLSPTAGVGCAFVRQAAHTPRPSFLPHPQSRSGTGDGAEAFAWRKSPGRKWTRDGKGRAGGDRPGFMSPVSSDPHSCLEARGVFHTRAPPIQFPPKPPPFPLFVLLPSPFPILLRGWAASQGQAWGFGTESVGVLGRSYKLRTSRLSAQRWKVGTQSPPSLLCPTPARCQARHGPVLLHCIPLVPQPSQPGWGDWGGGT